MLNLEIFIATSGSVPDRTPQDVLFHLIEELGEVAMTMHRPEKASEPLSGELADVLNCLMDLSMRTRSAPPVMPNYFGMADIDPKVVFLDLTHAVGQITFLSRTDLDYWISTAVGHVYSIYQSYYGSDLSELQNQLELKCAKWHRVANL